MTVIFDFTEYLENSVQIAKGSNPEFLSEYFTNPAEQVFFHCYFNPGHIGTVNKFLEYYLVFRFKSSASQTIAYKWQIKTSGGAWIDLVTGNAISGAGSPYETVVLKTGVYASSIVLPIEVRLIGTDNDASWSVTIGGATYICVMRAVGTV